MDISGVLKIRKLRNRMIAVYTVMSVCLYAAVCTFLIVSCNRSMKKQSMEYASETGRHLQQNIDFYIHSIESSCSLIFEEQEEREFYPSGGDEYSIEEEELMGEINNKLLSLGFMQNFCDFGIVYSSGNHAGAISYRTIEAFGEDIFSRLYQRAESSGGSVWLTEYEVSLNRLYYIKTVNQNALFVTSINSEELDPLLGDLGESSRTQVYLTDGDGSIIYASINSGSTNGESVPEELAELFGDEVNVSASGKNRIGTAVECSNGWRIYCCVSDTSFIALSTQSKTWFAAILSASLALLIVTGFAVSAGFVDEMFYKRYADPESLDDRTGLISGIALEEAVCDKMETSLMGSTFAFVLVKIKDLDFIKERLGTEYSDGCMKRLGEILTAAFYEEDIVGVNEKDEFAIFADFTDFDIFKAHNDLREKCMSVCRGFEDLYMGETGEHKLYMAMGACVYPDNANTFDELYECASLALEAAEKAEKDSCVFYDKLKKGGVRREN